MHKFTDEQLQFIREIASGRHVAEITEMVNKHFNLELKVSQIEACKKSHKIRSGIDCRFGKGHIPANKGKKGSMSPEQYKKCQATMFKKGRMPQNHRPIGSERTDRYGYVLIKVEEPNKWRPKHRVLWEKANGPIPEKHRLIFADGNKQNITLENLILVSYAQSFIMNKQNLFRSNANFTKTGSIIAKVIDTINKKK